MTTRPAWADRLRASRQYRTPRWSQLRAVLALEDKAREFGLALPARQSLLRMIKGWERGDHEPGDFYRSLWALVYDMPERVLFAELSPSALSVLGLGLVAVESTPACQEGLATRRHNVLLGGSLLGAVASVGPSDTYGVGMNEVREVAAAARTLQRWDRQFGGWVPYHAATGYVDSAMRLVRGSYSEKVGRRLLPAVADLCAVAGWVAYDIGRPQESQTYFALGVQIAQQGEDPAIAARLLCDMARVNADLGNPMQSVELLGLASHLARSDITPTVLAKVHSMEAKTYAILGRAEPCRRALDKAETALGRGPSDDEPAWIAYFDEAQFAGVVGSCHRDLAALDPTQAVQAEAPIKRALAARPKDQVRNRAFDLTNLATARLRRRELDGMCESGEQATDLALDLKSHRVNSRLRSLVKQAESFRETHSGVHALSERVATLPDLA
jgi:hypothetical protein